MSRLDSGEGPLAIRGRMIQLDVLRGVAALLVLGTHFVYDPAHAGYLTPFAIIWKRFGWTGVDLFFVLSGFLVGGLLFREIRDHGDLDVRRFLIRRAFKIWPAYYFYLTILFFILLARFHGDWAHAGKHILVNAIHIQNYTGSIRGHLWSLAVEEHFYLLLPILLVWLLARKCRSGGPILSLREVPWIALFVSIFCLIVRCLTSLWLPYREWHHYSGTHIRIDSLFFGVMIGYFYHFHPERVARFARRKGLLFALGLGFLCPMMFLESKSPFVVTFGYTLLAVGYGGILLAAIYSPAEARLGGLVWNGFPARLIAQIGIFSYSIYLWQTDIANLPMQYALTWPLWTHLPATPRFLCATAAYLLLATFGGFLMSQLVETPALALRERLFPGSDGGIKSRMPLQSQRKVAGQ